MRDRLVQQLDSLHHTESAHASLMAELERERSVLLTAIADFALLEQHSN
jgi:hypothetical protein